MTAETGGPVSAPHGRPPLDDIMLAMDVVDTLRRRERLVRKELDEAGREEDLKRRLRGIYSQQGIEVPDHVLEQGVAALKEDRFTYKPPQAGIARRLALIYVRRGRWGKWLGGGLAAAVLAAAANYFMVIAPDRALPEELARRHAEVVAVAATDHARETAQKIHDAGVSALRSDDSEAAKAALMRLEQLRNSLQREYTIRIVNRPGERSGVWRVPDVNQSAKNFYVVVEAVGADGERLEVTVQDEETGTSERVLVWGLRVDEATFDAVGRDKRDDGIIQNDRFGYKRRGHLKPEYEMPSSGGAITRW